MHNATIESKPEYPRISAGTFSSILVEKMLIEEQLIEEPKMIAQLKFIRSKNAILSLCNKEIDLSIMHEHSLEKNLPSEIDTEDLLDWTAVLLRPTSQPIFKLSTISWEEKKSFGYKLLAEFKRKNQDFFQDSEETLGDSFLSALEKIRRNLPYQLVIPDIYLVDRDLKVLDALKGENPVKGKLIAVFRTGDRDLLSKYINKEIWEKSARLIGYY